MTSSADIEQAFVLAESALSAARLAVESAGAAERAAAESSILARSALDAALTAFEHASKGRGDG